MEEIKPVSPKLEESLKILKDCQEKAYQTIASIMMERMENPTKDNEELTAAAVMSVIAIECLIELARSGVDMLSDVNDKDGAIRTILKTNDITVTTF